MSAAQKQSQLRLSRTNSPTLETDSSHPSWECFIMTPVEFSISLGKSGGADSEGSVRVGAAGYLDHILIPCKPGVKHIQTDAVTLKTTEHTSAAVACV